MPSYHKIKILDIDLTLQGSFDGTCNFLRALREHMPYIRIASLQLTRDQQAQPPSCKTEITLHVFGPPRAAVLNTTKGVSQ